MANALWLSVKKQNSMKMSAVETEADKYLIPYPLLIAVWAIDLTFTD